MLLAFYSIDNSGDYTRDSFNDMTDDEIIKSLSELLDDEVKFYDMSHYGYGAVPSPNMADFVEDYNDELLDGGWWCIALNSSK